MDPEIQAQLEDQRAWFVVTGNVCFAWNAVLLLMQQPPPITVPSWLQEHLRQTSSNLWGAMAEMRVEDIPNYTSEALGVSSRGRNAVAEWREYLTYPNLVGSYELEKGIQQELIAQDRRDRGSTERKSAYEHAEALFAKKWNVTKEQARRRIGAARKTLSAVAEAKGEKFDLGALEDHAQAMRDFGAQLTQMVVEGTARQVPEKNSTEYRQARSGERAEQAPMKRTGKKKV